MLIQNREITHPDVTLLVRNAEDELPGQAPSPVNPHAQFVIAYVLGRPVGCGALIPLSEEEAEIGWLYVLPVHRRAGVARRMVLALERKALAARKSELLLALSTGQEELMPFCVSLGYERTQANGPFKKKL